MLCRRVPRSAGIAVFGWAVFAGSWIAGSSPTLHSTLASQKDQPRHMQQARSADDSLSWFSLSFGSNSKHNKRGDMGSEQVDGALEPKEHIDVEAAPPASEVLTPLLGGGGADAMSSNGNDPWMRPGQGAWRLIILFQHNLPILMQAVDGYVDSHDGVPIALCSVVADNLTRFAG